MKTETTVKTEVLNVRVSGELLEAAREKAQMEDRPLSMVVRELLKEWVRQG